MRDGSWILERPSSQVDAERRVWRMTAEQRVAAMYAGELSFHQLCAWSSRYPDQVPVLDGELWFLAVLTPELADAQTPSIVALPTLADAVAVAEAAGEKACDAETAAWEAYYQHGAPRAGVDAATLATDTAELELRRAQRPARNNGTGSGAKPRAGPRNRRHPEARRPRPGRLSPQRHRGHRHAELPPRGSAPPGGQRQGVIAPRTAPSRQALAGSVPALA